MLLGAIAWLLEIVARELILFAGVGLLIGGLDELLVDLIWFARAGWRRMAVVPRHGAATVATLPPPARPGRLAVFVPAWREAAVVGRMLEATLSRFVHADYRVYLGCYPNDPDTRAVAEAIAARDDRLRVVVNERPGPTTKADCLNACWRALKIDEQRWGRPVKAVVLHDAEDVVHPAELTIFDLLVERFDLVQLPVVPLADRTSKWVAGTYLDEFAEAHGKTLVVREALGAGMPSAGVGCAIARATLTANARANGGLPFQEDSLTEDYELGVRLAEGGGRGIFVRIRPAVREPVVAVRAYFPPTVEAAVRQKARWITGIALAGWDRLGWAGGLGERWMRLRDRRALLSALVIFASYAGLVVEGLAWVFDGVAGRPTPPFSDPMLVLVDANAILLGWRLLMRWAFVRDAHGADEAWRSVPRVVVGNFIAVLAAWRAVQRYRSMRRLGAIEWDKTEHAFPDVLPAA